MEFINGLNLTQYLRSHIRLQNEQLWTLARQMALALIELNMIKIVHRDIKPDNIMVVREVDGNPSFKLTDFGVSRFLNTKSLASTLAGTAGYYAPEALTDKYDNRCDVFSLGVVLLEGAIGEYPFVKVRECSYEYLCATNQLKSVIESVIQEAIEDETLRNVVSKMLAVEVTNRTGVTQLLGLLRSSDTKKQGSFEFDALDEAVMETVLHYTGLRDRIDFERVNKKFRYILNLVWSKQEGLSFTSQSVRGSYMYCGDVTHSKLQYNDYVVKRKFSSFLQIVRKSVNLKVVSVQLHTSEQVFDLSVLPKTIEHISLKTNNFIAENFYASHLNCVIFKRLDETSTSIALGLISKHTNSLNTIVFPTITSIGQTTVLNDVKHLKVLQMKMSEEGWKSLTNTKDLEYVNCGREFEFSDYPNVSRVLIDKLNFQDSIIEYYGAQLKFVERTYRSEEHPWFNEIFFYRLAKLAVNLEILVLNMKDVDLFLSGTFTMMKLKTILVTANNTSSNTITINYLNERFPKLHHYQLKFLGLPKSTVTSISQWNIYPKLHPKRKIFIDIQGIQYFDWEITESNLIVNGKFGYN